MPTAKKKINPEHSKVLSDLGQVLRLDADLKSVIKTLTKDEVRCIVDYYYMVQENRKRSSNQISALSKCGEPHSLILYLNKQTAVLENQIVRAMDEWTDHHPVSKRLKDRVYGIGPVISAGLVAHIDIKKAKTAGSIWRFAGLDPTSTWNKGEARPWNASLKTLCWKIGQSFMKFSTATDKVTGSPSCFYGNLYRKQKEFLVDKNQNKGFEDNSKKILSAKKFRNAEVKAKYESGMLPDGHIDSMARRWAVKLFLSNFHELWCKIEGIPCPQPYVMSHLGHVHHIIQPDLLGD